MRIATICVRSGSKGIPGKNLKSISGKSLIEISTQQAVRSTLFDCIIVSSDSDEMIEESLRHGASHFVKRPSNLAGDTASKPETIKHALCNIPVNLESVKTIVDLDVTSPLRTIADISNAVHLLEKESLCSVLSGSESRRNPYFNIVEQNSSGYLEISKKPLNPIFGRQQAPKCYELNASIHVWNRECLIREPKIIYEQTRIFEMPQARSHDIDSETDFEIVEFLYNSNSELQI